MPVINAPLAPFLKEKYPHTPYQDFVVISVEQGDYEWVRRGQNVRNSIALNLRTETF
ncbi:MAG: hypothetical protein BROFUL_00302 [Candidatus Brocadia fulgida]|uniref:Uncharacterized protein n=1 Tax=Candidatus Brocadia fulgida TaxID=380242 RepID=A0A0M2UYS2_9BACT|nr:MAG: hypothetical protein BROFUL_00302 [Candidatus Brocadia fulgida]